MKLWRKIEKWREARFIKKAIVSSFNDVFVQNEPICLIMEDGDKIIAYPNGDLVVKIKFKYFKKIKKWFLKWIVVPKNRIIE